MTETRRALISVSNKDGIVEFAQGLNELGFEIISTGGTLTTLTAARLKVRPVSEVTGVPEILGGRVKTLHPSIFGGILARREMSEDLRILRELGIGLIDIVAVNLYPFEQTVARAGATDEEIIENIDIGGPSLLRAAAKNYAHLYPVVDPADYPQVLRVLATANDGGPRHNNDGRELRRRLAAKVFEHCSAYDQAISAYLSIDSYGTTHAEARELPQQLNLVWPVRQHLRYGENPHQQAAFYADPNQAPPSLAHCRQLQGKELSYNNYLDGDAALEMAREFDTPAAVIIKHANPCGVGRADTIAEAYQHALASDPVSAFGGIVGLNRPLDAQAAQAMAELFLEVIIAPEFTPEALEILGKKKNLRLLESGNLTPRLPGMNYRTVSGGMLAQTADTNISKRESMTVLTRAQPTADDWDGLMFAWKVVRWVRSNAIVYADRHRTLGIGAGQTSRIDAARFGLTKAQDEGRNNGTEGVRGAYVASDGFFPFRDVVDLVAAAGVRAIIQPGGSVRDEESITAANEHNIIMVITGQRHFRH